MCEVIGATDLDDPGNQKRRLASDFSVCFRKNAGLSDDMPVGLALVDIRLAQRGYPVEQHAARIRKDDRGLETLAMIGGGRDLVDASSVKMIGPLPKTVVVDSPAIFRLGAERHL